MFPTPMITSGVPAALTYVTRYTDETNDNRDRHLVPHWDHLMQPGIAAITDLVDFETSQSCWT